MIWPFIYEALVPRLLTLTLCRQVTMIILSHNAYHLAFDARGDRTTAEEKNSPHLIHENMHHPLCMNDHLNR